jgi:hypothetical protein
MSRETLSSSTGPISAGAIAFSGGGHELTLTPSAGHYENLGDTATDWSAGTPITIMALGDWVSAFGGVVTMPEAATIQAVSPTLGPPAQPALVSRAQDLSLRWTGATRGNLEVDLFVCTQPASDGTCGMSSTVQCEFDATTGSGTIPAAALATLPITTAGQLSAMTRNQQTVNAGGFQIELLADQVCAEAGSANPFFLFFATQ